MRVCPQCGYQAEERICPSDGFPMVSEGLFERGDLAPELVGRRFGDRYQVEALIGRGGMGWVFRAVHLVMQQTVALKVMRRDVARDLSAVKRFSREARDCSRLRHHNTIKVHDFGVSDDGYPYLVMEYLEGRPLSRLIKDEGGLGLARAAHIARQICASLDEAHDLGLVHRDLKPANVFLTRVHNQDDYVKVLDFGIAKTVGDEIGESLTESGVVIGTPKYLSPEQAQARPLDRRSDLYSLGIILYELVTGRVPFDAPSTGALLAKQIYEPPPPLPEQAAGHRLPSALRALVAQLLAKEPFERPPTARAVAERLEAIAAGRDGGYLADTGTSIPLSPAVGPPETAELPGARARGTPPLPEPRGTGAARAAASAITLAPALASGEVALEDSADQSLPALTAPTRVDPRATRRFWARGVLAGLAAAALAFFGVRALIGSKPPPAPPELAGAPAGAAPAPTAAAPPSVAAPIDPGPAAPGGATSPPASGPEPGAVMAAGAAAGAGAGAAAGGPPRDSAASGPLPGRPAGHPRPAASEPPAPDPAAAAAEPAEPAEPEEPVEPAEPVAPAALARAAAPRPVAVRLESTPTGARVREGAALLGATPLTLDVVPGTTRHLVLEKRGRIVTAVELDAARPERVVPLASAPRAAGGTGRRPGGGAAAAALASPASPPAAAPPAAPSSEPAEKKPEVKIRLK
jgi:serine/threonine-protein kinase